MSTFDTAKFIEKTEREATKAGIRAILTNDAEERRAQLEKRDKMRKLCEVLRSFDRRYERADFPTVEYLDGGTLRTY